MSESLLTSVSPLESVQKTVRLIESPSNEFDFLSMSLKQIAPQTILTPSLGFNLILPSDNKSILFSSEHGIVICNKHTLEVVKSLKLIPEQVKSLLYSEHQSLLFLGDRKGNLSIFNSQTFQEQKKLKIHSSTISRMSLSFDELLLYSCGMNGEVSVTDLNTFEVKVLYTHGEDSIHSFDTSSDGELIVSVGENWVKLYSIMSETVLNSTETKGDIYTSVKFNPSGDKFVTGDHRGLLTVWEVASWEAKVLGDHGSDISKVWFAERFAVSAGSDKNIRIWSLDSSLRPTLLKSPDIILDLVLDSEDLYILCPSSLTFMKIPEIPNHTLLKIQSRAPTNLLHSSKQKLLFSSSGEKKVFVICTETLTVCKVIEFDGCAGAMCLAADQRFLYVALSTKNIRRHMIDEELAGEVFAQTDAMATSMACTPDHNYLVTIDSSCKCILRKVTDGEILCYFSNHRLSGILVAITHFSNILVTYGGDLTMYLYDLGTQKNIGKMGEVQGDMSRMHISQDDRLVALSTRQGFVYIFSIEKQACIHVIRVKLLLGSDLYFTMDNRYLVVSTFDMNGSELCFYALDGFNLVASIGSPKQCQSFNFVGEENFVAVGEENAILFRGNPLKTQKMEIVGPDLVYPTEFIQYLLDISRGKPVGYKPLMDQFTVFPMCINSLHFYSNYNLSSHLEKGLSAGSNILTTDQCSDILSISLAKGFSDSIQLILRHIIESLKTNPYAAGFVENSLTTLNYESCQELEDFYNSVFFKSLDLSLPRFSATTDAFYKSNYFEIIPSLLIQSETTGKSIVFYQSAVKINTQIGSQLSINYMQSLLDTGNNEIFRSRFIETMLQRKWMQVKWFIEILALFYMVYLVVLGLFTLDQEDPIFLYLLIGTNTVLIAYEFLQICLTRLKYFEDMWNMIDLLRILVFVIYFSLGAEYSILLFFLNLFSWAKGVSYFRIFSSTRYMVNLLQEVFKDIFAFIVIFFYFTIAFTFMVASIDESTDHSSFSIGDTYLLNFGSFSIDSKYSWSNWVCFVISSLINFLVMVNLLISIIGDTYDKVQTFKDIADRRELTEIILEIEELMIWERKACKSEYFHVVYSDSQVRGGSNWEGKVRELKNAIGCIEVSIKEHHEGIDKKFKEISINISDINAKLDKIIDKK